MSKYFGSKNHFFPVHTLRDHYALRITCFRQYVAMVFNAFQKKLILDFEMLMGGSVYPIYQIRTICLPIFVPETASLPSTNSFLSSFQNKCAPMCAPMFPRCPAWILPMRMLRKCWPKSTCASLRAS